MAQRVRTNLTINQENARIVTKSSVLGAVPLATKRPALSEIGNEITNRRITALKKGGTIQPCKTHVLEKEILEADLQNIKKRTNCLVLTGSKCKRVRKRTGEVLPLVILCRDKQLTKPVKSQLIKDVSKKEVTKPKQVVPKEVADVEDIDKGDNGDPLLVPEYVNDVYAYLRELEARFPIKTDHLKGQEVTSKMRSVLIDWLVEVHQQFHLLLETLYLTVAILDRYLQDVKTTTRKKLQLVGVGAMLLACKYEEMYAPEVSDFVYICDNAYTKSEILSMEMSMLSTLKFSFSRPLPLHFLRRYSKAAHALPVVHTMAKYFLELCLVDYSMSHYPPSLISAAAIYLALWVTRTANKAVWTKTLAHYSTYSYRDIEDIVKKIANLVLKVESSNYHAVSTKYANSKFLKVSCSPELKSASLRKLASS